MTNLETARVTDPTLRTEADGATEVYRIWPGDGHAPGSDDWTHSEITVPMPFYQSENRATWNVAVPTLTRFDPIAGTANGSAMVIAPGGAFHFLMIDHEGYKLARILAARGITAFVLKYRLVPMPSDHDGMMAARNEMHRQMSHSKTTGEMTPVWQSINEARLYSAEDGRQAMRFLRRHAAELNLDPERIGIGGFSAGGAVAMGVAYEHAPDSRPAFVANIYGPPPATTPPPPSAAPLFLVHSHDDAQVDAAASARLYLAWKEAGIPAELHVFADGAHGYGTDRSGQLPDSWLILFDRWLTALGFLAPAGTPVGQMFDALTATGAGDEHLRRTRERAS